MGSHDEAVSSSNGGAGGNSLHPNASLSRPLSNMSLPSSQRSVSEKRSADLEASPVVKTVSFSSATRPSTAELRESRREVRTLPSWVQSYEVDEDEDPNNALLPSYPHDAQLAQHNHTPSNKHFGRLHDSARERTPVMMRAPVREHSSRWRSFIQVSAHPAAMEEGSVRVDDNWLAENGGDLDTPWKSVTEMKEKPFSWVKRIQLILLKNAAIPLVLRTIVWTFSVMAMALACSIYVLSRKYGYDQRPSTIMAIVLSTLALVYVFAVTYDEYTGQPIGLRSAKTKMRLILLDLWFIIFGSANLSLAFDAITDSRWGCHDDISLSGRIISMRVAPLCHRQEALSGILLIALLAWILTFAVSVFRIEPCVMTNE